MSEQDEAGASADAASSGDEGMHDLASIAALLGDATTAEQVLDIACHHAVPGVPAAAGVLTMLREDEPAVVVTSGVEGHDVDADGVPGGFVTTVTVPLTGAGAGVGSLVLAWDEPHDTAEAPQQFLDVVAPMVSQAVRRAEAGDDQRRYRSLYDANTVAMLSGEDDLILDANDAFLELIGRRRPELAGGINWHSITPVDQYASVDEFERDLSGHQDQLVAEEFVRPDGSRSPVLVARSLIGVDPVRWTAVVFDLGEHEQLRSMAATETAIVNTLLESAPIGFAVFDAELRFQRVNQRVAEMHGVPVEDHLGRYVFDVVPGMADAEPAMRRVLATGEPLVDMEVTGTTPAAPGVERTWMASFFPVRLRDGTAIGLAAVATEITERKQLERELVALTDLLDTVLMAAPVGVAIFDTDKRYVRTNDAYVEASDLSAAEHVGLTIFDVMAAEPAQQVDGWLTKVLETGEPLLNLETEATIDDALVEFIAHYYPVRRDDAVSGVGVIVVDVTERNLLHRTLQDGLQNYIEVQGSALNELQHMLLPDLPVLASGSLEARYWAAESVARVGGDWYDAVETAPDELMLSIGDAVGHGLDAVKIMDLARQALRSSLSNGASLTEAMSFASTALHGDGTDFATSVLTCIDLTTGLVEFVVAGHPPPLIRRADGTVERLDEAHGPVLGPWTDVGYAETSVHLHPGDTLVLYTDGMIERRGDASIDTGIDRLAAVLADSWDDPDEILTRCLDGSNHDDDACLMVFTYQPES